VSKYKTDAEVLAFNDGLQTALYSLLEVLEDNPQNIRWHERPGVAYTKAVLRESIMRVDEKVIRVIKEAHERSKGETLV
jgi:hypothetical protein